MEFDDVLAAWRVNNQVTCVLLELCPDAALDVKPGKGKTVRGNLTHIVNVRRMWCLEKLRKQAEELPKLDHKTATRVEIMEALGHTSELMEQYLLKVRERPGRWSVALFLAYAVAHEANHRAQIEMALRVNGHEAPDEAQFALWDWPKIAKQFEGTN
ncbi:MAG: DinB family protein [Fimbriimonadaceae bacterium]